MFSLCSTERARVVTKRTGQEPKFLTEKRTYCTYFASLDSLALTIDSIERYYSYYSTVF